MPRNNNTVTISLSFNNKEFEFTTPQTENMSRVVVGIFQNHTYPILTFLSGVADIIIDIGANIGTSSVFFQLAYNVPTVSYEPCAANFELLQKNTAPLPGITPIHAGIYNRECTRTLHLGGGGGETCSLFANAMTEEEQETITLLPAAAEFRRIAGSCRCAILKIDTEGCETQIIEDLTDYLPQIGAIYLEYHSEEDRRTLDSKLCAAGYTLYSAYSRTPHRGDLCFVRTEWLDRLTEFDKYAIRGD
jgi:FkbM family methyltransferase